MTMSDPSQEGTVPWEIAQGVSGWYVGVEEAVMADMLSFVSGADVTVVVVDIAVFVVGAAEKSKNIKETSTWVIYFKAVGVFEE